MKEPILFDQFSRYKVCADILEKLATPNDTVLDVGSGVECVLGKLLPNHNITYVDPLFYSLPDKKDNMMAGNVFTKELDGKVFDCVICVDTLEHIPSDLRQPFIEKISKLAKNSIILANPCSDVGDAVETDKWISNILKKIFNQDNIWLKEHIQYGLPRLDNTLNKLHSLDWKTQVLQNGHTPWLRQLLLFTLIPLESKKLSEKVFELSKYFNENLYEFDHMEPSYRQVIIATKQKVPTFKNPVITSELKEIAYKKWKYVEVSILEEQGKAFNEFDTMLASYDNKLDELTAHYERKLAELEQKTKALKLQYDSLKLQYQGAQKTINDIHQSFVFRTLKKYDNTIGKVIPLKAKKYLPSSQEAISLDEQNKVVIDALDNTLTKKDILCFSIIPWNYRIQRPQHLLEKFAKKGHRVFYVAPNCKTLERAYEIIKIKNNIYQVTFSLRYYFDIYQDEFDVSATSELLKKFKKFKTDLNIDGICFVQFPSWEPLVLELRNLFNYKIIFDVLDDFTNFPNISSKRKNEEKLLLQKSDLSVTTSSLLTKKAKDFSKNTIFIPNAGEFSHFNNPFNTNSLKEYKKPIVGYFGSIAEWFDIDLLEHVATSRPDLTFILIGHTAGADIRQMDKLPNVYFLGEQPYSELPNYLHEFDVCMIPFKLNSLINSTHPVKLYEYLSAGKPTVCTNIPELASMKELCYIANDKEQFLQMIDKALNENDDLIRKRIEFASNNTWDDRFKMLYAAIEKIPDIHLDKHIGSQVIDN